MKPVVRNVLGVALGLALAPALHAQWTVEGQCQYQDRQYTTSPPYGWSGTYLDKPIRHAVVLVVEEGGPTVYAQGATDAAGSFRLIASIPSGATFRVVCSTRIADGVFGDQLFHVTDASQNEYSLSSEAFLADGSGGFVDTGRLVAAAVEIEIVGAPPPNDLVPGNPFNLLDLLVDTIQYVKSVGAADPSKRIGIRWPSSPTRVTWDASGATVEASHAYADGDPLLLHELGHALQMVYASFLTFSDIHHLTDANGNPYQACTEAWATYLAGVVQRFRGDANPGLYLDLSTYASSPVGIYRLEDAYPVQALIGGEASEGAIASALWDIADDASTPDLWPGDDDLVNGTYLFTGNKTGEQALWEVTTGPFSSSPPVMKTIEALWNGLYLPANYGQFRAVRLLFDTLEIRFYEDGDEPNDTLETATPLALDTWSGIRTLYSTDNVPAVPGAPVPEPSGGDGGGSGGGGTDPGGPTGGALMAPDTGDHDIYSFPVLAGQVVEVETRYPNGAVTAHTYCDPYIVVREPGGSVVPGGETTSGGYGRNAKVTFTGSVSGVFTVEVHADPLTGRRLGSYEVRARIVP